MIRPISKDRFVLTNVNPVGLTLAQPISLICDKQDNPPAKPTRLSASNANGIITLSWIDNSSTETGFVIIRKDSINGTWSEIGNANINATVYTDTLFAAGKYWYRVKATSSNGDSAGSNVVKVTIGN